MTTLNAYSIYWAIAIPTKGKATKADFKKFSKQGFNQIGTLNAFVRHSGKLDILKEKIAAVQGISKEYQILIITDKQMSMSKNGNFMEVATTMQKQAIFTI